MLELPYVQLPADTSGSVRFSAPGSCPQCNTGSRQVLYGQSSTHGLSAVRCVLFALGVRVWHRTASAWCSSRVVFYTLEHHERTLSHPVLASSSDLYGRHWPRD